MNTFTLLATAEKTFGNGMSVAERLQNGGKMILVLMAFVFSVIFIIFFSQSVISMVINGIQNKAGSKSKEINEKQAPRVKEETAAPVTEVTESVSCDDDVTVAVITAALAAYLASVSEDGNVLPFRVVSFKRKNSGKPWNS
ncbi:MAG: OadG family protein [Clostridia bacterium]|nr:OadG family protein [Clostridia bacterium]